MTSQLEKAQTFKALHESDETFVIPNPRTEASCVPAREGRVDGQVSLDEKLDHCRDLSSVTEIPITADFENGFAAAPAEAAANLLKVAETGLVGGSIEDYSGSEIYDFNLAVERIAACAEAVSKLSFPFSLTARAEGLLCRSGDFDDIIKRLQAFEAAGASELYAPGLGSLEQVKMVMDSVSRPVNVLAAFMPDVSLAQYAELGVRRISVGSALANHATQATLAVANQMRTSGRFDWM